METIGSYIIGICAVVSIMLLWAFVQSLWKRVFPEHVTNSDAMAGRTKCANCNCTSAVCEKKIKKFKT